MKNIGRIILYSIAGALAFWAPDVALHAKRYESPGVRTILLPSTLLLVYWLSWRMKRRELDHPSIAFYMILGVWLLGPTAMMVGATFYGGGFADKEGLIAIPLGLVPFYTFMMAGYDASLLGLLLATALSVFAHFLLEERHWIMPPKIRAWLMRGFQRG